METESIRSFLNDKQIGVLIVLDEGEALYDKAAYIKQPDKEGCDELHHEVKLKTYFDEIFIYEEKGRYFSDLQLMYIPLEKNCLRFKEWQKGFEPVYLFNDGKETLEVKTPYGVYAIPAGKWVRAHKDEYTYRKEGFSDPNVDTISYENGR